MKKLILFFMVAIFLISFASADLGTFKQNDTVSLKANLNGTFVTVSVYLPNGTIAIKNNTMTLIMGNIWEYSFTNTTEDGDYVYDYCDNNGLNCKENVFEITSTGTTLSTEKSVIYVVFFLLFIFLFIVTLLGIKQLPSSNEQDEWGKIMSISYLKYLRPILWVFEWVLLLGIMFLASNLGYAYLGETLFAKMFYNIFTIMFTLTLPMIVIWFVWIIVRMYHDKQFQAMLNRGMFPQGKM